MTLRGAASRPLDSWWRAGFRARQVLRGDLWGAGGLNSVPARGGRARPAAEEPGRPGWHMLRGWVWTVSWTPQGELWWQGSPHKERGSADPDGAAAVAVESSLRVAARRGAPSPEHGADEEPRPEGEWTLPLTGLAGNPGL